MHICSMCIMLYCLPMNTPFSEPPGNKHKIQVWDRPTHAYYPQNAVIYSGIIVQLP